LEDVKIMDLLWKTYVAECDEDHVCDWTSREERTGDELADEVDADLLVCDCHDYADWQVEDYADAKSEQ